MDETQQLVEVARTSWSPALNLDSFVAMNFSAPEILRLQPQAVPESTSHLKPGDISDSNSSWIPCGVVVTPTHCQKGRWGEHILRSFMTLYAYKELLNTARQASSCIFRNCGKKKRWMIWNWQYCVSAGMIIYKITVPRERGPGQAPALLSRDAAWRRDAATLLGAATLRRSMAGATLRRCLALRRCDAGWRRDAAWRCDAATLDGGATLRRCLALRRCDAGWRHDAATLRGASTLRRCEWPVRRWCFEWPAWL